MSLRHIYVSHAGQDASIATKLAENLRNAGHDTRVSTLDLSIGDNVIRFMNDGLTWAHTVLILISRHVTEAIWQRLEIDSAIWNEHAQNGGRCLVIKLDDTPIPPLLGPKLYATLDAQSPESLQALVQQISEETLERPSASGVVAQALQRSSRNPFRHLRAEFFEDRPELHARAFAPPDAVTAGSLEEMKPTFLEGTRGTGKSMLLLSLRARNYLRRTRADPRSVSTFGWYLKLTPGAICNAGVKLPADGALDSQSATVFAQLTDLTEQELVLQLIESLFSELEHCAAAGIVAVDPAAMKALADGAARQLSESSAESVHSVGDFLDRLANTHKLLAAYIRRRFIYDEEAVLPVASFDLSQLKRVIGLVRHNVPALHNSMFVVLLDEYENLRPYQQRVVNTFVKLSAPHLSVKIAKKLASEDTSGTTAGQDLQEPHDYSRATLVYDVENPDQWARYLELLRHMVRNLCSCERLDGVDVESLLPSDSSPEVPEERVLEEVAQLAKMAPSAFSKLSETERRQKTTYYREAAIYRVLLGGKGRHKDKRFAGFEQLAFVSSGVIRYFQEFLGVAYHLTYGGSNLPCTPLVIPTAHQARAVHVVSQHTLTTLSRNVEELGEELKYFLLDLGDCLRHKLLKHTSEPEAARLTIEDPELLGQPGMHTLRKLLLTGLREGVFQTKEGLPAFKPKHSSDPQPVEFAVSRIYAPVLQVSPRLRWRTTVTCSMLLELTRPGNRGEAMQELKAALVRVRSSSADGQMAFLREGGQ